MVCLYECIFWFVAIVQPSLNPLMSQMFSFLPLKKYTAVLSSGCLSCHRQSALSQRAQVNLSAVCCWFAFIFDADFTRSPSLLSRLGWLLHVYFISVSLFSAGIKFIANCALMLPRTGNTNFINSREHIMTKLVLQVLHILACSLIFSVRMKRSSGNWCRLLRSVYSVHMFFT